MFKKAGIALGTGIGGISLLLGSAFAFGPGPNANTTVAGQDIPLAVASELIGISQDDLKAELAGGTTIPTLLEENGVDLTVFEQDVAAARQAALDDAVAAGTISPERAQVMAENMEQAQVSAGPNGPQYQAGERSGDCTGDGNQYQNGQADASTLGSSWGVPGDGTGPGLEHQYGQTDTSAQGKSWGIPGDATGPGLEHQYGSSSK
jgi:hypothetical protein